jgi:MFS family permease
MTTQTTWEILTRDFIFAFLAQFTFTIASHVLTPTLPIYLSRLGSRETEIGVLIGVFTVSSLVLRPLVGRALLKIPEKRLMMIGAAVYGLSSIAYLLALPFWPFFAVRFFHGIGYAFFYTASFTLIANISPEAHRGQSLSYFLVALNLSLALGPSLGMFVINRYSFTLLFWACFGLSLCSLWVVSKLGKREKVPVDDASARGQFFLSREALLPSTLSFIFFINWGALTAFFPLFAVNQGMANPGLFFTILAIILILSRILGAKLSDRYSSDRVLSPCLVLLVASMVILAFSKSLLMFILVAIVWGMGHAFFYPALVVYVLERVGASRGLAMGTLTAMSDLGMFVGPAIMGIVIHLTSYPVMFLSLAFLGIVNLSFFHFYLKRRKGNLPAEG